MQWQRIWGDLGFAIWKVVQGCTGKAIQKKTENSSVRALDVPSAFKWLSLVLTVMYLLVTIK